MIPAAGLTWRGNANELVASYAVCLLLPNGLSSLLIIGGRWLRACERSRCICDYLWTWRVVRLLWYGWSVCRICKSFQLQVKSLPVLRCIGPRRAYCGISINIRDEESCYYAS